MDNSLSVQLGRPGAAGASGRARRGSYGHRARALRAAGRGPTAAALRELDASWKLDRPRIVDQAVDVAWVHLIAGDVARAVQALELGIRGREGVPAQARELLAECVSLRPSLVRRALGASVRGGTFADRVRAASLVLGARARPRV